MRSSRFVAAVALALALPLSGCGEDRGDDAEAAEATGAEVRATGGAPEIEVVDRGVRPRRLLRLDAQEGQIEATSMTMRQRQTISGGPPTEVPPISITFSTEVLEAGPDRIATEIVYDRPTVEHRGADSAMVSQLEDAPSHRLPA